MAIDFAINPMSEDFRRNSAQYYSRLLRERPVARTDLDQWLVCRHADVLRVLTDRDSFQRPNTWSVGRKPPGPLREFGRNNMVGMNPPDHTRFRQAAAAAFAPGRIRAMAPRIEAIVDELLQRMAEKQDGDFIRDFAAPLPIYVICALLGVPEEDHDLFGRCTADILASLEMAADEDVFERGTRAAGILYDYCRDIATEREREPREDLISILIEREREQRLNRDEAIWIAVTMLIAGHETTTHMLGNGLLALIRNPEQYALLAGEPERAANAVEEILRYDPTLYVLFRESRSEVEIGGQTIPAGSFIIASLYAANRDPALFADPDAFDIQRANADKHLSFAAGNVLCLGHALARLEGKITFSRIFDRLRDFELGAEPVPREGLMFRGYLSLPMRWRAA